MSTPKEKMDIVTKTEFLKSRQRNKRKEKILTKMRSQMTKTQQRLRDTIEDVTPDVKAVLAKRSFIKCPVFKCEHTGTFSTEEEMIAHYNNSHQDLVALGLTLRKESKNAEVQGQVKDNLLT